MKFTGTQLLELGFPAGPALGLALSTVAALPDNFPDYVVGARLGELATDPAQYADDPTWGPVARLLLDVKPQEVVLTAPRAYRVWGGEEIEPGAYAQMDVAMRLPISVDGALMPDAHQGYGLPIGGVLACDNAVIPYGVGVDIGCRMMLSVLDTHPLEMEYAEQLKRVLLDHTRFGEQREHEKPGEAPELEDPRFREIPLLKRLHQTARLQLGTSGGGNHFVEFGELVLETGNALGLSAGKYLALMSHSGSRGLGANIADHYTKLAKTLRPMPKVAEHLAWLGLDTEAGQEYWAAMTLAGDYAEACHRDIHARIHRAFGSQPLGLVTNAHNLAWKELHNGRELVVHRKGATPAGEGVAGIIPGSMATPAFLVRGKGLVESLHSASHGAGRRLSRTQAKNTVAPTAMSDFLAGAGVTLLGGGLDESPMAYKDIHQVMQAQADLVAVEGVFTPRVVRMAPPEKARPWQKKKDPLAGE